MNAQILKHYKKARRQGNSAAYSLKSARRKVQWDALENAGLVRMETKPDETPDLSFLGKYSNRWEKGAVDRKKTRDWERNQYRYFIPADEKYARENYKQMTRAERDGVWGIVGEYRISADDEWEQADSVWGFIGDDWKGSGYDTDIMAGTIDALRST